MQVVVASQNPVKLNAVKEAFGLMLPSQAFEVVGVSADSGVAEQPMSDEETLRGAINRVNNAQTQNPAAAYWVGIEGGVADAAGDIECFAWVVVKNAAGTVGKGRAATFILPEAVAQKVRTGMELGAAADAVYNEHNSKQKQGTIGILTRGVIDRTKYYVEPTVLALIPFAQE